MVTPSEPAPLISQRPGQIWPVGVIVTTIAAILSLLSLFGAGYWMIRAAYGGYDWTYVLSDDRHLYVSFVDPDGPASGRLFIADEIVSVNGTPPSLDRNWGLLNVGDSVLFRLRDRQGVERNASVVLVAPSTITTLVERFSPLIVSLAFWLSGLVVVALVWRDGRDALVARLFFAFCQLVVVFVCFGQIASVLGDPAVRIMMSLSGWLGAVAIDFHVRFPRPWNRQPIIRIGIAILYVAALAATALAVGLPYGSDFEQVRQILSVWITMCLVVVIFMLGLALVRKGANAPLVQTRVVAFTTMVGMLPAFLFSMMPEILVLPHLTVPIAWTFPFMAIAPVGYVYAILRYRLIRYDRTFSRAIGYLLAVWILVGILVGVVLTLLSFRLIPDGPVFVAAIVVLTIVLVVAFEPARKRIQQAVDQIFDRPWTEFRTTLLSVDETLAGEPDVATWAAAVCRQFATALDLGRVGLLYRVPHESVFRLAVHDPANAPPPMNEFEAGQAFMAHVASIERPTPAREVRAALGLTIASPTQEAWLMTDAFDLWWPIRTREQLKAMLLLGPRSSALTADEVELLALTSHQIGVTLENAEYARELEQLSRSALQTRDDERRRVSRELHDHIIQPLVGLNFSLATVRDAPEAIAARKQISDLIVDVRKISADLRPPALDEVGLGAAARGLVRTFARSSGMEVRFVVLPDEDIEVPEPIASTIYTALREALNNVQTHAHATQVSVLLEVSAGRVMLVVHDDGVGFTQPDRLSQLATTGHFGLLGLQERLAAVRGTLVIQTGPGQGTRLECQAPLAGGQSA